jgi:peptide deformylase
MDLKLVSEDSQVLREVAELWDFEKDGDPSELVKAMSKLMVLHNGIGLAAPQCGIAKRIFVMGNSDHLVACINPEIISGTETIRDLEGCLSFPDLWMYVERYKDISVEYYNVAGEKVQQEFIGLMARVFQHELQHLDGICFDTEVSKLALDRAKEKRKKIRAKKAVLLK